MLKKIALFVFLCLPLGMFAQELKIAHVNYMDIFNVMPETAAAESELVKIQQAWRTELQTMETEYNKKYTEFMQQQDSLAQSIKVRRMQEIQDVKDRIENSFQQAEQDIAKKRNDLNEPIVQKIKNAIKLVGEEHGYTYVLEASSFMYISPKSVDATPLVKAKLGIK